MASDNNIVPNGADGKPEDAAPLAEDYAPSGLIESLEEIAPIKAYAERLLTVGEMAKGAMIRYRSYSRIDFTIMENGYPKSLLSLRVKDGVVTPSVPGDTQADVTTFQPDQAEAALILAGWTAAAARMPQMAERVFAPTDLPMVGKLRGSFEADRAARQGKDKYGRQVEWDYFLFPIYSTKPVEGLGRSEKSWPIVLLQARTDTEDGKDYRNWQPYTDARWRNSEPALLPIYNQHILYDPDPIRYRAAVWIHEGVRAAAYFQWMAEGKSRAAREACERHPWGRHIRLANHVGWIGGANNPYRTDWSVIGKCGAKIAYVIADNDAAGKAAVRDVARTLRHYELPLMRVTFDSQFGAGFDLYDEFPDAMFSPPAADDPAQIRPYSGPSFADMADPATWQTEPLPVQVRAGPGRPAARQYRVRDVALRDWVVVKLNTGSVFINLNNPRKPYKREGADDVMRKYSDVRNLSELLLQYAIEEVSGITYQPGRGPILTMARGRCVNTWSAPKLAPKRRTAKGRSPFDRYLEHLFPVEEEREFLRKYLATLFAVPHVRMEIGLLLQTETQGAGKGTICKIIEAVLGADAVGQPSESDLIGSSYNDHLMNVRVVFVHEIYAGHNWKAYQALKSLITEKDIWVKEKYIPGYMTEIACHLIMCTNAPVPLSLEVSDRRIFVPTMNEELWGKPNFVELYRYIKEEGAAEILQWAKDYVAMHGHHPAQVEPPMTAKKKTIINKSKVEWKEQIKGLVEEARTMWAGSDQPDFCLVEHEVRDWLVHIGALGKFMPSYEELCEAMVTEGMFKSVRQKVKGRKGHFCCFLAETAERTGVGNLFISPAKIMGEGPEGFI